MNVYEIAILFDPGLEVDLEKATDKVEKILTDNGGKITNVDNWGKRKLAYQIRKQDQAIYVFYTAELPGESIRKIESILNITDEVIRFLVTRPDLKAIAKAEAEKARKAEQAAKRGDSDDKDEEDEE
ncbi:30S ribosomal protein S6 [Candidatus Saccharibacteria bacterium]|nr:30S ribosomal protein S6 [Candidatus Saccharibacteria bacterium]